MAGHTGEGFFSLGVKRHQVLGKTQISTKKERFPKGERLTGLKWLRLSRKAEPGIKLLRWEVENIQVERQYTKIGIYRGRLSEARSFTRALKNSTNTASNYTTINNPAAHAQMRHLTECAQQIQQLPGESILEGPRGNRGTGMLSPAQEERSMCCPAQPFLC